MSRRDRRRLVRPYMQRACGEASNVVRPAGEVARLADRVELRHDTSIARLVVEKKWHSVDI
eukprot:scaffold79414_cov30-Tisochrysis_lutea.AAC.3